MANPLVLSGPEMALIRQCFELQRKSYLRAMNTAKVPGVGDLYAAALAALDKLEVKIASSV